ncbi:MAG: BlaI/MecI/CopY family transcriptional regulator [Bacteroidales bacterium]|nr:BlaI/MecI/CopY family transcriptional regulator [Bacteroidales bacterium]
MTIMRDLTKAEEQIMQVLWQKGPSFVKEIIPELPDPRPAYSTISTIVRILQEKGFVGHKAYGPTHQYFPIVTKEDYSHFTMKKMLNNYFDGSMKKMVSFFSKKEKMDTKEVEEILELLKKMQK